MSDTDKPNNFFDFEKEQQIALSSDELFAIIDSADMETIERESNHDELFDEFSDSFLPPLQTVTGGKKYIDGEIAELEISDFDIDIAGNHLSSENQTRNSAMSEQNIVHTISEKSAEENKKKR